MAEIVEGWRVNEEEFRQLYLCAFKSSEKDIYLHNLAKEYHERTESYDRKVCTGPIIDNAIMPITNEQRSLISKNAYAIKKELLARAWNEKEINSNDVQKAISKYIAY